MLSTRQALLRYLQFLQENGFLYACTNTSGTELQEVIESSAMEKDQKNHDDIAAPLPVHSRIHLLDSLMKEAEACRACPLGATRNKLVFADGSPTAKLVFVGEGPGGEEDRRGLPFVGRAGQLLDKMIAAIGFKREEVYICNTVKCRPPENRDPLPDEKTACEHFLKKQLTLVQPQLLVALGSHAAKYLCHSEASIGQLRGRWHIYQGVPLLATYHPAFLLRNPAQKIKAWEDFQMIHARYMAMNPDEYHPIWTKKEA